MTIYGDVEKVTRCPECGAELRHGPDTLFEETFESEIECENDHLWNVIDVFHGPGEMSFKLSGPQRRP